MFLQVIEHALEECENDFDSAIKFLLNLHVGPTECNVDPIYQSPSGMSTELQVADEGKLWTSGCCLSSMMLC